MARPPLDVGTYGEIRYVSAGSRVKAVADYRDYDGVVRQVGRTSDTKPAAAKRLRLALRDRGRVSPGEEITPETKVAVVAEVWFEAFREAVEDGRKSPTTLRQYRDRLDNQVLPALGALRVREISVSRVDRLLKVTAQKHGKGTAKITRTVVSGVLGLAVRHDALGVNLVKGVGRIEGLPRGVAKALTREEAIDLRTKIAANPKAVSWDLVDFTDFMLATGLRIGEAAAITWGAVDLDEATVEVRGTVIRETGKPLYIKGKPKSRSGWRTLELPSWAVAMLCARRPEGAAEDGVVFPAVRGTLRDPRNTNADLRVVFDAAGYEWVTSHVYRKTVATLMDESGLAARVIADQLGHAQVSMTQDVYLGRKTRKTGAAAVLEALSSGNENRA